jgi:ABC-type xylose transport system permease subunit
MSGVPRSGGYRAWRAGAVWCVLLLLAVINGAAREAWLVRQFDAETAHVLSTLMLCLWILAAVWWLGPWLRLRSERQALRTGLAWVVLTLAFEFLVGHYLLGRPWSALWEDYDLKDGHIWPLVLIVTAASPWLVWRAGHRN